MQKNIAALTLGGLLLFSAPAWSSEGWIADFDEAIKVAKAENKDLFVDFTGSDWCGWCIKLDNEVFKHEEFLSGMKDNYVLVALDYPKKEENIAKVPNMERNRELQQKYEVRGFPTVLLMNSDGEVYGQTGYRKNGPVSYVEHINELRETGRKALVKSKEDKLKAEKALAAYNAAGEGEAKLEALNGVLAIMLELEFDSDLAEPMVEAAQSALTLDPNNETGLKLKGVHALSNAGEHSAELLTTAKELDPKNTAGVLETQVHAMFQNVKDDATARAALAELDGLNLVAYQDKSTGFLLNFTAANWAQGPMSDMGLATKYAKKAKSIGSKSADRMKFIDDLLGSDATPPVDK